MGAITRVKVCCIQSVDEARLAVAAGAAAIGLVAEMPSGPGPIPERRIAEIAASVPPGVASVLLTSLTEPAAIVDQQRRCRVNAVQLCRLLAASDLARLRVALPGVSVVQVVHVTGPEAIAAACALAGNVDAVLLDSGDPRRDVLGGTGRTHDWALSRQIRDQLSLPVFLAGGLDAGNVGSAIARVRPFAVDLCSGVRVDGLLDEDRLAAFMAAVRAA